MIRRGRFTPDYGRPPGDAIRPRRSPAPLATFTECGVPPGGVHWTTGTFSNRGAGEALTLEKLEAMRAQIGPPPEPSVEALEQASFLGWFALGVPCCAGALPGGRIRVVALEPVTALDLGVARMKLSRWYPWAVEVIELAAAGRWTRGATR